MNKKIPALMLSVVLILGLMTIFVHAGSRNEDLSSQYCQLGFWAEAPLFMAGIGVKNSIGEPLFTLSFGYPTYFGKRGALVSDDTSYPSRMSQLTLNPTSESKIEAAARRIRNRYPSISEYTLMRRVSEQLQHTLLYFSWGSVVVTPEEDSEYYSRRAFGFGTLWPISLFGRSTTQEYGRVGLIYYNENSNKNTVALHLGIGVEF